MSRFSQTSKLLTGRMFVSGGEARLPFPVQQAWAGSNSANVPASPKMRYRILGTEVRSENAAKPMGQPFQALVRWLASRSRVSAALDYGCGKLRYTPYLARSCLALGIVDSNVQLERPQLIDGRLTSVSRYARRRWPQCRVYVVEQFWAGVRERYDFVLCANVLSAIPSRRARSRSLRAIKACLPPGGECLVVNQHANSYFQEAKRRAGAVAHLDGWMLHSLRGACYYGILGRDKTVRILRSVGFAVLDAWVEKQSTFVLAAKGPR
jgi:Methyltransferase domain